MCPICINVCGIICTDTDITPIGASMTAHLRFKWIDSPSSTQLQTTKLDLEGGSVDWLCHHLHGQTPSSAFYLAQAGARFHFPVSLTPGVYSVALTARWRELGEAGSGESFHSGFQFSLWSGWGELDWTKMDLNVKCDMAWRDLPENSLLQVKGVLYDTRGGHSDS